MGFKKPKARKGDKDPLDDGRERDFDPTKAFSGGNKVKKRGAKQATDMPRSFQYVMQFMEKKTQRRQESKKAKQVEKKQKKRADGPREITESLKMKPGESMGAFERRVRQKMENNLQLVGTSHEAAKSATTEDGGGEAGLSKRAAARKRNSALRKERQRAKKTQESSDEEGSGEVPRFGEQAQAPPVFRALPKERFKKAVPLPNSKEEAMEKKRREEQAIKQMIQRTSRQSPLERMQARRKAKEAGDTAAEKRIMEAEREKAVRRYRMLRATREAAKGTS
ncbi:hypothetical protein GGF46_004026 [Coemansia sp. RSA 552]|nr:hypothetical protein GGF46_004026 [Coemansia sp. RSA 552]